MKLLIITAVSAFENDMKLMLKEAGVSVFSCQEVTGYKDVTDEDIEGNWFAGEMIANDSIMCYAFASATATDKVLQLADAFNAKQDFVSKLHVAILPIEKSSNLVK